MKKLYIIGAGPGGISAALYAKRANLDVTIIYQDKSSLNMAHEIDNYYGLPHISGKYLYEIGLKQAQDLNIKMIKEEVLSLEFADDKYKIITNENHYLADAIILSSGAYRNTPSIKNIKDFEGKGVSYCATCDGFFYRKKRIGIIGNGKYAAHEAEYLANLTDNLFILTDGKDLDDKTLKNYQIINKKIDSLVGDDALSKIKFKDETELELDGLFIAIGSAGSTDLARKMGILVSDDNKIIVNDVCMSNIAGIYAIGDATKGMPQIAKAVYEGALAATNVLSYFKNN